MDKYENSRLNESQISQLLAVARDAQRLFNEVWKYTDPEYLDAGKPPLPKEVVDIASWLGGELHILAEVGVDMDKVVLDYAGQAAFATFKD